MNFKSFDHQVSFYCLPPYGDFHVSDGTFLVPPDVVSAVHVTRSNADDGALLVFIFLVLPFRYLFVFFPLGSRRAFHCA